VSKNTKHIHVLFMCLTTCTAYSCHNLTECPRPIGSTSAMVCVLRCANIPNFCNSKCLTLFSELRYQRNARAMPYYSVSTALGSCIITQMKPFCNSSISVIVYILLTFCKFLSTWHYHIWNHILTKFPKSTAFSCGQCHHVF